MEKKKIVETLAHNVKALMNQQNMSSVELARKCRVSSGTVSKIINANMSITIPMLITLAEGLNVNTQDLLQGLDQVQPKPVITKNNSAKKEVFLAGVLSLGHKIMACVKDASGNILGMSETEGDLDLAETLPSVLELIMQSIHTALPNNYKKINLRDINLAAVVQSYEFEEKRSKFESLASKQFNAILVLPDWKITYFAAFNKAPGISVVTDKGVSVSYLHHGQLKKLGGWKFPVDDRGGENWLGVETIRHTIDAFEGYVPMSGLARDVLAKFNGKLENITEACFKSKHDPDVYCLFADILLRSYLTGDQAAANIVSSGFKLIYRAVDKIDKTLCMKPNIIINGSLTDIYKKFIPAERIVSSPDSSKKISLLADMAKDI